MSSLSNQDVAPTIVDWEQDYSIFEENKESIKWNINAQQHTIYMPTLHEIALGILIPHCLLVRMKVQNVVANDLHHGRSMFMVFNRTLSTSLQGVWDQLMVDPNFGGNLPPLNQRTLAEFDMMLRAFIGVHMVEQDRDDLIAQLRSPKKPRSMPVQSFLYRYRELNSWVNWIPGQQAALNADDTRRSFFKAMPDTWKKRFDDAGMNLNIPMAEMVRYFRKQESNARLRELENHRQQRSQAKKRTRNGSPKETPSKADKDNAAPPKRSNGAKTHISQKDPCPIHPLGNHTWGQCFQNAFGENAGKKPEFKKRRTNGNSNPKSTGKPAEKADGNAAQMDDDVSMTSTDEAIFTNGCIR